MQKFLFITKYISKIIIATSVILFVCSYPIIATYFRPAQKSKELFYSESEDLVLDMWHIESFEGGSLARTTFLDKLFKEYNRQNTGVFISLKVMSVEQYHVNIKS